MVNIEEVKKYNAELKKYKDQASQLKASIDFHTKALESSCESLSKELGITVTPDNIEEVYKDYEQRLMQSLETGRVVLAKIANSGDAVEAQRKVEENNQPIQQPIQQVQQQPTQQVQPQPIQQVQPEMVQGTPVQAGQFISNGQTGEFGQVAQQPVNPVTFQQEIQQPVTPVPQENVQVLTNGFESQPTNGFMQQAGSFKI